MLYLVGGAARSGKSILAGRFLRQHGVPYFSLDYLTNGLVDVLPTVEHQRAPHDRAERLWPVLGPMLQSIADGEPSYFVEGDALLPDRIAPMVAQSGGRIRACFLGYARGPIAQIARAIRTHPSPTNDWTAGASDDEIMALIMEMRSFSRHLEAACGRLGLPYFDSGDGFEAAIQAATRELLNAV